MLGRLLEAHAHRVLTRSLNGLVLKLCQSLTIQWFGIMLHNVTQTSTIYNTFFLGPFK